VVPQQSEAVNHNVLAPDLTPTRGHMGAHSDAFLAWVGHRQLHLFSSQNTAESFGIFSSRETRGASFCDRALLN
jgi:hypothetical protein